MRGPWAVPFQVLPRNSVAPSRQGTRSWLEGLLVSVLCVSATVLLVDQVRVFLSRVGVSPSARVTEGKTVTVRGSFRSPWDDQVVVRNVVAGCSCSKATVDPTTIGPGCNVQVGVTFDSTGKHTGGYDLSVSLLDDQGTYREVPLRFRVEIVPDPQPR
mgnify:CR=1 FL=1